MGSAPQLLGASKPTTPIADSAEKDHIWPIVRRWLLILITPLGLVAITLIILPFVVTWLLRRWKSSRWGSRRRSTSRSRVPLHRRLYIRKWFLNAFAEPESASQPYDDESAVGSSPLFIDPHPPLPVSRSGIAGPPSSPVAGWQILEDRPRDLSKQWPAEIRQSHTSLVTDSGGHGRQSSWDSAVTEPAACGQNTSGTIYHMRWWDGSRRGDSEMPRRGRGYRRLLASFPWHYIIGDSNAEQEAANGDRLGTRLPMSSVAFYTRLDRDLDLERRRLLIEG